MHSWKLTSILQSIAYRKLVPDILHARSMSSYRNLGYTAIHTVIRLVIKSVNQFIPPY